MRGEPESRVGTRPCRSPATTIPTCNSWSRRYSRTTCGGTATEDVSPIDAAEFDLPNGMFVLATVDGRPAAMGGWRRHRGDSSQVPAEMRRMYVSEQYRGRGLARAILARLETTAGRRVAVR